MRRVSDEPYGFCLSCTSEWITAESRFPPLPSHLLSDARVLIASGARLTDTLSLDVLSWPPTHPGYVYICIYLYTRTHTHTYVLTSYQVSRPALQTIRVFSVQREGQGARSGHFGCV